MKLYDRKLSWKIFCLIGQGRTLSHAAQECGIDLPYASRLISKLEDELGFFLVLHRPHPMKLSENGIKIFPFAEEFVAAQDRLENECREIGVNLQKIPKRSIRISLPINLNKEPLLEKLVNYERREGSGVTFEFSADIGLRALIERETDISVGFYRKEEPTLTCRQIAEYRFPLLASKKYLAEHPAPKKAQDLEKHVLLLRYKTSPAFSPILLKKSANKTSDPNTSIDLERLPHVLKGDGSYCRSMLLKDVGISVDLTLGVVAEEIQSGKLELVLPAWGRPDAPLCVYCRNSNSESPLYREVIDLISTEISKIVSEERALFDQLASRSLG